MKAKTHHLDGEFWFTVQYAASLLATTRHLVEAMAVRELIRSREDGSKILIAEADVTRFRRDPKALAAAKVASRIPGFVSKTESMPGDTVYKGDAPKPSLRAKLPVGNPLADERKM